MGAGVAGGGAAPNRDGKVGFVAAMGLAGEIGWANMLPGDGNATYRNRIIDAVFTMDAAALEEGARYELV